MSFRLLLPDACVQLIVRCLLTARCAETAASRHRPHVDAKPMDMQVQMRLWKRGSGGMRVAAPLTGKARP